MIYTCSICGANSPPLNSPMHSHYLGTVCRYVRSIFLLLHSELHLGDGRATAIYRVVVVPKRRKGWKVCLPVCLLTGLPAGLLLLLAPSSASLA